MPSVPDRAERVTILSSQSNGNGSALEIPDEGLVGTLIVYGTFNNATAKLQISPDGGSTWIDVPGAGFTANAVESLDVRADQVRGTVSGGSGSESINMELW